MADEQQTIEREGTFGSYISEEILDQIDLRQKIHGRSLPQNTPNLERIYETEYHNAPWVCLRSSVDVPKGTYKPGTKPATDGGALAKQFVLCGGTMELVKGDDGKSKLIFASDSHLGVAGYGYDKTYGYRPRPGITKVTVKTKDTFGCIMEAVVDFTVYSLEDLEAVDKLYFKPGMSALLEWGHSVYVLNDGAAAKVAKPKLFELDRFFDNKDTYEEINKRLQNWRADQEEVNGKLKRKTQPQFDGNYEAMFGLITNFSWSFNNDGSYACTVKLLSQGTILEGLQVPANAGLLGLGKASAKSYREQEIERLQNLIPGLRKQQEKLEIGSSERIKLNDQATALQRRLNKLTDDRIHQQTKEHNKSKDEEGSEQYELKSSFHWILNQMLEEVRVTKTTGTVHGATYIYNPTWQVYSSDPFEWSEDPDKQYEFIGNIVVQKEAGNNSQDPKGTKTMAYIKLNDLLRIFNRIFETQVQNLNIGFTKFETRDDPDYSEQAFATFPEHFSLKPNEVLLPFSPTTTRETYAVKVKVGEKQEEQILNIKEILDQLKINGQTSSLKTGENRIGDILVEVNFILSCLDSVLDSNKGTYNVRDFLDNVISGIQLALGNVNDFGIHINHATETASIVDRKCISHNPYVAMTEQKPIIVSGPKTTVTDLKIASEVSSEIATEMSVAATAPADGKHIDKSNPNQVFWNEGCIDRHRAQITEGETLQSTSYLNREAYSTKIYNNQPSVVLNDSNRVFADAGDFFTRAIALYGVLNKGEDSSKADWSTIQQDGQTLFNSCLVRDLIFAGQDTAAQSQSYLQAGVIPIKVGFTMKGIGRFVIGTTFKISQGLVPSKYKDWRQLITGVEHNIDRSGWKTTVTALYYPVLPGTAGNIRPKTGTNELATGWTPGTSMKKAEESIKDRAAVVKQAQEVKKMQDGFFKQYWSKRISTGGSICAKYVVDMARCWAGGKSVLDAPMISAGANAGDTYVTGGRSVLVDTLAGAGWQETRYYKDTSVKTIKQKLQGITEAGTIAVYFMKGPNPNTDRKGINYWNIHQHVQMKAPEISSGWTSSNTTNYGCDFVYGSYTDINDYPWDLYILTPPNLNKDWQ